MTAEDLMIRNVLGSWKQSVAQVDKTLASLSDEDLQGEVAPGKNRIYYLLGHLTAVNDRLLPLLRLGERLHPELDDAFIANPDRTFPRDAVEPSALRSAWSEVSGKLLAAFEQLKAEEWLERHDAISAEDFTKEPLRNRLAVLLSRTQHTAYHAGQIRLAQSQ
jgi:hypothetical protein